MILTYETSIFIEPNSSQFNIKIRDTSSWPVDAINRSDRALAFVVQDIDASPLDSTVGSRIIYDELFTNAERSMMDFVVRKDGYYQAYLLPIGLTPTNVDGDVYYIPGAETVQHRVGGVYIEKTLEEVISEGLLINLNKRDFPANPFISVKLDSIAEKYSKGRSGSSDPDFKLWTTIYIQLYGALLSFDKQAFFEYDRKVKAANRLFK